MLALSTLQIARSPRRSLILSARSPLVTTGSDAAPAALAASHASTALVLRSSQSCVSTAGIYKEPRLLVVQAVEHSIRHRLRSPFLVLLKRSLQTGLARRFLLDDPGLVGR